MKDPTKENMLTQEEIREISEQFPLYPTRRAVAPDALRVVQRHRGWVSDEALAEVAELLDMTPAELDSIATFYNLIYRKPVGRHVILLCDSVSCWIVGQEDLLAHLKTRLGVELGQTSADGRFTLLPVCCLGACDHAPVMMIDEDMHLDLTAEKIDRVLEDYA